MTDREVAADLSGSDRTVNILDTHTYTHYIFVINTVEKEYDMPKYDSLNTYLSAQTRDHVPMTFAEIERIVGSALPPSRRHRAWWSNNSSNNVMTQQWLAAGYKTESVDMAGEKLVFRRVGKPVRTVGANGRTGGGGAGRKGSSVPGYYGCMKGTVKFDRSFDPTGPADPEWAKVYGDG